MSEEHKRKISEANKCRQLSEESRKKISETLKGHKYGVGRVQSEDTKKKISQSLKGKRKGVKFSDEHKKNISDALKGHVFSEETKEKMSITMTGRYRGANNPNWKGGVTRDIQIIRSSKVYQRWRISVLERDGYVCVTCGCADDLHIHHIVPMSENIDMSLDVGNGVTLCYACHCKEHPNRYLLRGDSHQLR
jgi:hypothetical protein